MILLDTILDKVITFNSIWDNLKELSPDLLPIILAAITLIISKSGLSFSINILKQG